MGTKMNVGVVLLYWQTDFAFSAPGAQGGDGGGGGWGRADAAGAAERRVS